MNWLKDCEICNVGLCKAVDELKGQGLSERQACKQMSDESDGLYSKEAIRGRYRLHTARREPHPGQAGHGDPPDEEKEIYQLCDKLKRITKALQRANPKPDSTLLGWNFGIKLKGAKRGFNRTVDQYPGEGTDNELLIWKTYFDVKELGRLALVIEGWLYDQLPKEQPENRSKPKKEKPRYA